MNAAMTDAFRRTAEEFETYYAHFDPDTDRLLALAEETDRLHGEETSYERKTALYELLCRECRVHLFRESDFFFEMSSGRGRFTWGGLQSPVGSYFHERTADQWLNVYRSELEQDRAEGFLYNWNNPVGFDHHCPGYDRILTLGLTGIVREAEDKLACCEDPRKQIFYRCVIRANQALMGLAERFAAEADRLAAQAAGAEEKTHYEKIAAAARQVPAHPPRTFYEGLCAVVFYRECVGSLEGIGFSTFGQLDRMLRPLYEADLLAGRLTREEALGLLCDLLLYTDVRFDTAHSYHETSTTIELGGCDAAGQVNFSDLTVLVLDAVLAVRSCGTKINCRISRRHPEAFLRNIALVQAENLPTVMMHNDDVLIPARIRAGAAVEDARLYVGGGCHEVVLEGTEVCTRADTWISLPRLLLATMEKITVCPSFDAFYRQFLADVRAYHEKIAAAKNRQEARWCEFDPLVLYSSSMLDCLEKGQDVTEGGARYNTTALSMVGVATVIDSLFAVKTLVFDKKALTMPQLNQILRDNFAGQEPLRQTIIRRLPKHGTNQEVLNDFSARVLADLSTVSGQRNGRGGPYLPAVYPHDIFRPLGEVLGATPDGRPAGAPLSRGVSPSEFVPTRSPLDLIHSLAPIDFTRFADSFCAELTLPRMEDTGRAVNVLTAIIKAFLEAEGSSLQFNLLDRRMLLDAKAHPEQYEGLTVRVCGYSARFTALEPNVQDEVIARAIR